MVLKKYKKDSMNLLKTGVGLSVGSSIVSSVGGNASFITPMAKGVGTLGSLVTLKAATGILQDSIKKKYKKKY